VHIAQVVPRGEQPWSGILTVIVHLSAALARRGHDVDVLQLHTWSPSAYAEQRRVLAGAGVAEVRVGGRWGLGRGAARIVEERAGEIVHLHGAFNPSNTMVSRALRRPYVFSPHSGYDPVSLRRSRGRKALYRAAFERKMIAEASLVVALTDAELADLRAGFGPGPYEVIPNGVAPPPDDVDGRAFRRALGIDPEQHLAVFVGRLDVHRKGLDVLVRGIAAAPAWHVAMIGPRFRGVEGLERKIDEVGARDRVHLVGERHGRALLESVASADIFALVSRWEGLPMALLESLSLGVPAVVSPAVERAIDVETAGAGWVATNEHDLGTLLRGLHRNEIEGRRQAAIELARRYDWNRIAERYETAYARVVRPG
jgi:glycosyltransferase involved in cell wall biosynthesis